MRKVKGVTQEQKHSVVESGPSKRAVGRLAMLGAIALFIVPVVVTSLTIIALIGRDVDAPDWVKTQLISQLEQVGEGLEIEIDTVKLRLGRDLHPRVRINGVTVQSNKQPVGQLRHVSALISPRGIVFEQAILLQDVAIDGARLLVRRDADGRVSLAFGAQGDLGKVPSLAALLDQIDQLFERPVLAAMETVSADGLILEYIDARAGRSWTVDGGRVTLALNGQATQIDGSLSLLSGGTDITRLDVSYGRRNRSGPASISLKIEDARAADLATQSPVFSWLSAVQAPISTQMRTTLGRDGLVGPMSVSMTIGAGAILPNGLTHPITFDGANAYLTYDPSDGHFQFDQIEAHAGGLTIHADGAAFSPLSDDGLPDSLLAQLRIKAVDLPPSDAFPDGLVLPPASLDLRLRFAPFTVDVGQLVFNDGDSRLIASGQAMAGADGWTLSADAAVDHVAATRLFDFWPRTVQPAARANARGKIVKGNLSQIEIALRSQPDHPKQAIMQWHFDDAELVSAPRLPNITRAKGTVIWQQDELVVRLQRGMMAAKTGGRLDLSGTVARLPLAEGAARPLIEIEAKGPARAAASVLAGLTEEPDGPLATILASTGGAVNTQIQVRVGATGSSPDYTAQGRLTRFASDQILQGRILTSRELRFEAAPSGYNVTGPVVHRGVRYNVKLDNPADGPAKVEIEGPLSQGTLASWGIQVPSGALNGQASAVMQVSVFDKKPPVYTLISDLSGLGVIVPAIGWRKPQTSLGKLRVDGTLGQSPTVDQVTLEAADLVLNGRLDLQAGGKLRRAVFDDLRVGRWFNGAATLTAVGDGHPMAVETSRGSIDLRRLPRSSGTGGAAGGGMPLALTLDRVQVTDTISITGMTARLNTKGGLSGQFSGQLNGGPDLSGTLMAQDGGTAVRLRADDAGAIIRSAGLVQTAVGGELDLVLRPTGQSGHFDGRLDITKIRLRDAPAMAALLDAISVVGLLQQLDGNGLMFEEVEADFRLTPEQVIVTRSSAVGAGLGVSLDGIFGLTQKRLDFQGVISPFYLLNGIGSILTRKGEGLIGFNFNLTGNVSAPVVDVNPLSVLTPGMFREIFRRPVPQVSQ